MPTLLVATLAFTAFDASSAETLYACANTKKGNLRLVASPSACNTKKETAVSWNTVGPQGLPGESGPNLRLVDANGQNLGTLLDWDEYTGTVRAFSEHLNAIILVEIDGGALGMEAFAGCCGEVYWDHDDCTGQPYTWVESSGFLVTDFDDPQRFYAPTVGPPATTIASKTLSGGGCLEFEDYAPQLGEYAPAKDVTNSLGFNLPLALPLRVEPADSAGAASSTRP